MARRGSVDAPETTTLLEVLRNHLGLMGTRYGCGLEQCGCCMVLVDGQPAYACTREVGTVAGRKVTTIEGLGTPAKPHPLQQAFLDEQAGQCGYCLSGILMSAKALLDRNPDPDAAPISWPRSTSISAAAARISASCARSNARPRRCATGGRHERARPARQAWSRIPRLDRWITFQPDRTVRIATGKVEMGQGVVTAHRPDRGRRARRAARSRRRAVGRHDRRTRRALHDLVAVDRGVRRLGAAGLRRGARQGARARGAAAQLQPRRAHGGRRPVPAERRGDRPGLLDASRPRSISRRPSPGRRRAKPVAVLQGGRPERAAHRPAGEDERRRLRARRAAARRAACAHAAPAQPRRHARRRSTRPRSGAPRRASCRSCARPISWPSSVRSRAWRRRAAVAAPLHAKWDNVRRSTRRSRRPPG